jgi:heme/copper-type cytochrome/quinol oxidase subunit 2
MGFLSVSVITLAILLIFFVIFLYKYKKSNGQLKPDYYGLFTFGFIWLFLGIPIKNYALSAMGLIFLIIGLANKSKWEENRKRWSNLTKEQKKIRIFLIIGLGILVLLGFVFSFLTEKNLLN